MMFFIKLTDCFIVLTDFRDDEIFTDNIFYMNYDTIKLNFEGVIYVLLQTI